MNSIKRLPTLLALVTALCGFRASADTIAVSNNVTAGTAQTWVASNTYVLKRIIYVETNAVLNIEPGTVIQGATGLNVESTPDVPNAVSGLIVTRGGKIFAEGTAAKPIIFTYDGDDVTNPNDIPLYTSGQWGGVTLLGNGLINSAGNANGNIASPKYDVYEGLSTNTGFFHIFGGTNDNESSGVLRYVSIRHSGRVLSGNREFNGLTMGGVGKGTIIEHVEVFGSSDDGFEWWGGNVNAKYLVAAFCEDDSFDYDQGYRGDNQFLFAIQKPSSALSEEGRGIETDGDLNQSNAGTGPVSGLGVTNELPRTIWRGYNMTVIGPGFGSINTAVITRDESGPNIFNSVFTEFGGGLQIDGDGLFEIRSVALDGTGSGEGDFRNNLWNVSSLSFSNANANVIFTNAARLNDTGSPLLTGVSRTNNYGLDPRPLPGSPLLTNVANVPANGFFTPTCYRGAFGPDDRWVDRWTAIYDLGVIALSTPCPIPTNTITITNNILSGTTNVWSATNVYLLTNVVYVETNAVLKIEPGTVIKGATGLSVGSTPGIPNAVSGLIVTRGGKLFAEGTAYQPIIFTYDGDNVNDPNDVPLYTSGQWGGVTLLGNGQVNSAQNSGGNVATPKYEVYEGLTDLPQHRFGGTNDNESSGVLRFVSIRHSGRVLTGNREFNGLTMGGVGKGTIIEHVEVFGSSDDGFEWWGGSVNAKYLVAAFCEDDSFDYDQGYRGDNQFLFAIQKPSSALSEEGRGVETDGDLNQSNAGTGPVSGLGVTNELPRTVWRGYNMTVIGPGLGSINTAVITRDESGPNILNSVFAEFGGGLQVDGDGLYELNTSLEGDFRNNLWRVSANSFSNANANFLFSDLARKNETLNPLLYEVSRTNDCLLDPRPLPGSPAFVNVAGTPANGFFTPTCYRGAFGSANWAEWTALVDLGVFSTNGLAKKPVAKILVPDVTQLTGTNGNVVVTFQTEDCTYYQLQCATNLANPTAWTEVARVKGTGVPAQFQTDDLATDNQKYYRVRVVQE